LHQGESFVVIGCLVSKLERLKEEWCRKSRPNFTLFDPV